MGEATYELEVVQLDPRDGAWLLDVQSDGVTVPVTLLPREVENPQRGIAAIESLFTAIRTK